MSTRINYVIIFVALFVASTFCPLASYGGRYKYGYRSSRIAHEYPYMYVYENLNIIRDADDLAKTMIVKIMHFLDSLEGRDDYWYADQANTKAEYLIRLFCRANPDAPNIFIEVAKINPDMMEDFIELGQWDSSVIPPIPAFDRVFWESVKIIAERKMGLNGRKM